MKIKILVKIGREDGPLGWDGERLTVGVNAPPVGGAANEKLIEVMSEWLGVGKSAIRIAKGHFARHKVLEVNTSQELFNGLTAALPRLPKQETLF